MSLPSKGPDRPGEPGRSAAAAYIADMSLELAGVARRHGLETLSYMLEIARLEAEAHARRNRE